MNCYKFFMVLIFFNLSIFAMNFDDLSLDVQIAFVDSLLKSENHKHSYAQNKKQLMELRQRKEDIDRVNKHADKNRHLPVIVSNIKACKQKLQPSTVSPPVDFFLRVKGFSWPQGLTGQDSLIDLYLPSWDISVESDVKNITLG